MFVPFIIMIASAAGAIFLYRSRYKLGIEGPAGSDYRSVIWWRRKRVWSLMGAVFLMVASMGSCMSLSTY
jgi:hypothetical protein